MSKAVWFAKQQVNKNVLDIYLYDDIEGDSENWWTGEVTESETSAKHIKKVLEEAGEVTQINLFINSYGGSVKEGLGIYNQLKRKNCQKTAYIDGFACSIASVIAMACDKVVMGTNSLMMIHHASTCAWGNSEELRKQANDLDVIDQASCSSYLSKAGDKLTEEKLTELLDNQTWLNAKQCIEYGLADEIVGEEDKNIKEAQQRFKQNIKDLVKQHEENLQVPPQYQSNKTFAEKLMKSFKKNIN
ncbi:head maturation protease, ClpP-related [Clostridium paraputrificum]|uniref:head maturation protease, ClpP-related n=1 Tax=Clostridium paraputrificum TaxID=29363 RepID=UPI000C07928B|nr:head maturation protease, ClpP-related [Clostridium paraputrificum]